MNIKYKKINQIEWLKIINNYNNNNKKVIFRELNYA